MKPNQTLIDALISAANSIENNPNKYCWGNPQTCNCGILATTLNPDLKQADFRKITTYSDITNSASNYFCQTTGVPVNKVVETLIGSGLSLEDFEYIEFLGLISFHDWFQDTAEYEKLYNKELKTYSYSTPGNVIKFFRELAASLQTQLVSELSIKTKQIVSQPINY